MDEDTEVYHSCSAKVNGEIFIFGGNDGDKQKQVQVSDSSSRISKFVLGI